MQEREEINEEETLEPVTYELGYHLLSTISDEEVASRVSALKELIEKAGGVFVAEEFPTKRQLAYPLSKEIEGKRQPFTDAYFGWVAFDVVPHAAVSLSDAFKANPSILRFLLIRVEKEDVMGIRKRVTIVPRPESRPKRVEKSSAGKILTDEELDQTIRELVGEK